MSADIAATTFVTVALSVVLHGATAAPLSRAYARHLEQRTATAPEHRSTRPFRTRFGAPEA